MPMIEFSEDLSKRYDGGAAVIQRAYYRLAVRAGEIPYFDGGLNIEEFSYGDISGAVKEVLSDFDVNFSVSGDTVCVGDVMISLPRGLV